MIRTHLPTPMEAQVFLRTDRSHLQQYIDLKLATLGLPHPRADHSEFLRLTDGLVKSYRESTRLLSGTLSPVDARIQRYLDRVLEGTGAPRLTLPSPTLVLDKPGLARELSLPIDGNDFKSELLSSYRIAQGVLHNPKSDRRTTKGTFHVVEEGLPVPPDKIAVPRHVFARLLEEALKPPAEMTLLPYTAAEKNPAHTFVSLLLRPVVVPEIPGRSPIKRMETRFFAPGSLISNLDFVENIFGNAGDPALPENDAALDVEHWTGHTGCVLLAPHLIRFTKKELGLPNIEHATERQIRDGMCWKEENEIYNGGDAFKVTTRDESGVIFTIIADNYFGYCKKEVKTQISYASNLYGNSEEEHAGGAIAFPRYNLGDRFRSDSNIGDQGQRMIDVLELLEGQIEPQPEGHAVDKEFPNIIYVPASTEIDLNTQTAKWTLNGRTSSIRIQPGETYVLPSGYKVDMEQHPGAPSWRLVGTVAEGTFCHKPCTVSGGGKSEISKSILDFVQFGPFFVSDFHRDIDLVDQILKRDYGDRFRNARANKRPGPSRPILSPLRTLGSVIKLLTPSEVDYNDAYNQWLESIDDDIKALIFIIKRFYRPEWGDNWREHFSTDLINGGPGHELKFKGRRLVAKYLRVGLQQDGSWRTFKLRQDFVSSAKIQMEDDITASTVVPRSWLNSPLSEKPCLKLTMNCENRLFQRPDEAVNRGADRQTEFDLAQPGNFLSNFEPLKPEYARAIIAETVNFQKFTEPMSKLIEGAAVGPEGTWFASSAHHRIVDGKPTKNPRYLQTRPDLLNPRSRYLAEIGLRLSRKVPTSKPIAFPVDAVLAGRRNNPPDRAAGIRPLAVYNPIHYQELPELFMDFICSLTGKSPSTTGAGSEGALTKGPFNALNATADLNGALLSYILTGYAGFTTAAGYVGPKYRVDHDVSLLIPELWARLNPEEREPAYLIQRGCLERLADFEHNGERILASRLGYRITAEFLRQFLGRVFDSPNSVFDEQMLKPEIQDLEAYVDGINNIVEAQQRVAKEYLSDGSVEGAIPPLKALIHIMATGTWEGHTANDPEVRRLFDRDYVLQSDWYKARLRTKQGRDAQLWGHHMKSLTEFLRRDSHRGEAERLGLRTRLQLAEKEFNRVSSPAYLESLVGTIGADPMYKG